MSIARGLIQDFEKRAQLFQIGLASNFSIGILGGAIIGTYFIAKYNQVATLDGGGLLGLGLATASAIIWTIVTIPWTKRIDFISWLKIIGAHLMIYSATAWMGYFLGSMFGILIAVILSKMW